MAAHVYLSVAPGARAADGTLKVAPDAEFRYRGEVAPGDDPVGYTERMAAAGHLVKVVTEFRGRSVTARTLEG